MRSTQSSNKTGTYCQFGPMAPFEVRNLACAPYVTSVVVRRINHDQIASLEQRRIL